MIKTMHLTNRTDADITFGTFVIPATKTVTLYDIGDKATYENAMYMCRNFFDAIKYAVVAKRLSFLFNDSIPFTKEEHFNSLWDVLKPMFTNHSIGFSSEHRFYFDLGREAFCVTNLITGKTYRIKMEKEGEGTPWLNQEGGGI